MTRLKPARGLTLLELLVALVLSSILMAGLYRTFVNQQKRHGVQEQVVDMQQNARAVIYRLVRDIRMAGFGRVVGESVPGMGTVSRILPVTFVGSKEETILYRSVINRDTPFPGWLTIITASNSPHQSAKLLGMASRFQITVDRILLEKDRPLFDVANRRYISVDGVESNAITHIAEDTSDPKNTAYRLTLQHPLLYRHRENTRVSPVTAVSFQLAGRQELGTVTQPMAENIESVTFEYFDSNGEPTGDDHKIRIVRIAIRSRTGRPDPEFKEGDGYRHREIASNVQVRNLSFVP